MSDRFGAFVAGHGPAPEHAATGALSGVSFSTGRK